MSPTAALSSTEMGERLRVARDDAGLTQADAAQALGIARTTLVAIEQGQRPAKIDEVQKLARLYATTVNALLRHEAVLVDLAPKFRKVMNADDAASRYASRLLSDLARAEVELENLLGVRRTSNLPPERPILPGDVRKQAEADALELRQRLGLGLAPVADIVTLLEFEMGVRVYVRRFDGSVSGLFAYDDVLGACILLNANHPRERRTQTAAHECGHLLATRRDPEVLNDATPERSPEERYCNAFSRNFLLPARALTLKFREITAGAARLTRRHVIVLAHSFGVSREALVRRLEELGLAKRGTWEWFEENGGISDNDARQVLGDLVFPDLQKTDANLPTTTRLGLLAYQAADRGLLSEGQLARLLHLSRPEVRQLLDGAGREGGQPDGVPLHHA